ncbi:MAG: ester cyclase [Rhodobacteraceae bacterium]|nr:ester cyclase [Paracoccaceae bacterium]
MNELATLKRTARALLHGLAAGGDAGNCCHDGANLWCSHPVNEIRGIDAIADFWLNLRRSLPDMERRDSIFVAGRCRSDRRTDMAVAGRPLVASLCHYQGTFSHSFLGIPPTHGVVHLRSCEVHHLVEGKIAHSWVLLDLLDLIRQAGLWPISPSLGTEGMWPAPATLDGAVDDALIRQGERSLDIVLSMQRALHEFDGASIESMPLERHWTPDFQYYAASGIGMTRGLHGFRVHHQIPFLNGFPDRRGAGHYVRIGDGNFAVTGGWPSVRCTHLGEWLGLPATGRQVSMRVMDFYRIENERIAENWVPIDILHVLWQLGCDVLGRLGHMLGNPPLEIRGVDRQALAPEGRPN